MAGAAATTVLVVEDEEIVRELMCEILLDAGYRPVGAEDGAKGLEIACRHAGAIGLVITDVQMPGLDGPELVRRLRESQPRLPALYVSGVTRDAALRDAAGHTGFLQKPFRMEDLVRTVRQMLDRGAAPARPVPASAARAG